MMERRVQRYASTSDPRKKEPIRTTRQMDFAQYTRRLVTTAVATGITAPPLYPAWTFLPLPDMLTRLFVFAFGPLLVVSFFGIGHFVRSYRPSVWDDLATLFGIIAGVLFSCMIIVHMSNLIYIRGYVEQTDTETTRETLRCIQRGVLTVQLGLDVVWDMFICGATVLLALALWSHPRFGTLFAVPGIAVGAATLAAQPLHLPRTARRRRTLRPRTRGRRVVSPCQHPTRAFAQMVEGVGDCTRKRRRLDPSNAFRDNPDRVGLG